MKTTVGRALRAGARFQASCLRGWLRTLRCDLSALEAFCLFIGYPRSSHSLVGALLNAHPDAVIAHELHALHYVDRGAGRRSLIGLILERDRWFAARGNRWNEFDYTVEGQSQGAYRRLRVIGDKKGGGTTGLLSRDPRALDRLQEAVGLPLRVIHVVRHPLDNISTIARRTGERRTGRTHAVLTLEEAADVYFDHARVNEKVRRRPDIPVLDFYSEELVGDPQASLKILCEFLGLEIERDYLEASAAIIRPAMHRTREAVEWRGLDETILERARQFDFLHRYE